MPFVLCERAPGRWLEHLGVTITPDHVPRAHADLRPTSLRTPDPLESGAPPAPTDKPAIGIIDTGAAWLPEDATFARATADGRLLSCAPYDADGHGTQLMSIVAQTAPGCPLHIVNAQLDSLAGSPRLGLVQICVALDWLLGLGTPVILMAFALAPQHRHALDPVIGQAAQRSRLVAAAGNRARPDPHGPVRLGLDAPAHVPGVISVGALNAEGAIARFSQRDLNGPLRYERGVDVRALDRQRRPMQISGTSAAAALAAARIWTRAQ